MTKRVSASIVPVVRPAMLFFVAALSISLQTSALAQVVPNPPNNTCQNANSDGTAAYNALLALYNAADGDDELQQSLYDQMVLLTQCCAAVNGASKEATCLCDNGPITSVSPLSSPPNCYGYP